MNAKVEYEVSPYDSQREGMVWVGGYRITGTVTGVTGRRFASVDICICRDEDDAKEIAELLNAKYAAVES